MRCEHAGDKGSEFDVAMVELVWHGTGELDLNCLEAVNELLVLAIGDHG